MAWWLVAALVFLVVAFVIWSLASLKQAVVVVGEGSTTEQHSDKDRAQVGSTAFVVSAFRAYESTRTDRPPLFTDSISVALFTDFSNSSLSFRSKLLGSLVGWLYGIAMRSWFPFSLVKNNRIVKLVDLLALRTYFIDEHIVSACDSSGIGQLVILGAGLDARGYRMKEFKGKVFEVDFPGLLKKKEQIFQKVGFSKPSNVYYVGTDFSLPTPCWDEDLASQGFDPKQPSIWVLEGLTAYLTAPELTSLFATLSSCSQVGSIVLVTWVGNPKKQTDLAASAKLDMHKYHLEHPDNLSSFPLESTGWELNEALSVGEASEMYFKKEWRRGILKEDRSYWLTCSIKKSN